MERFYERLSAQDSSFLGFESETTPMHVAGLSVYAAGPLGGPDGSVDVPRVRAHIASRLHLIPRYRQRLAYAPVDGQPFWIDDDRFALDDHVFSIALPRPGTDRELKEVTAEIVARPLDLSRPLWEVWVIEGLEGGRFGMLTKIHHSVIDGASGVDLLTVLLSPTADDTAIEEPKPWTPRPAPSGLALLGDEMLRRAQKPLALARKTVEALADPQALAATLRDGAWAVWRTFEEGLKGAADTPLNGPIGCERRFDWTDLDLAEVKAVKNALGGTVNDVMLATAAGAVREFLEGRGMDVDAIDFRAVVPVNVRAESERGRLGNRVAAWITALPVEERDPERRLAKVREATGSLKETSQSLGAEILNQIGDWLGYRALAGALALTNRVRPYNLIVTNVRGPDFGFYMLGAQMLSCYPALPLFEHQGLGLALFSYRGRIHCGLVADRDLVPDLADFAAAIRRSFRALQRAAKRRAPAPRAKRSRRAATGTTWIESGAPIAGTA